VPLTYLWGFIWLAQAMDLLQYLGVVFVVVAIIVVTLSGSAADEGSKHIWEDSQENDTLLSDTSTNEGEKLVLDDSQKQVALILNSLPE
jgi:uncharacterized membrane protein